MGRPAGAALAAAFLVLGAGAVIAQSDPITTRMGLMKENQSNAEIVVRMMRGQVPFDAAKVEAAFAQWADTAQKLPSLFPDNSKSGQKTRAAPKIWTAKADFDDKAAALAEGRCGKSRQGEGLARRRAPPFRRSEMRATPATRTIASRSNDVRVASLVWNITVCGGRPDAP